MKHKFRLTIFAVLLVGFGIGFLPSARVDVSPLSAAPAGQRTGTGDGQELARNFGGNVAASQDAAEDRLVHFSILVKNAYAVGLQVIPENSRFAVERVQYIHKKPHLDLTKFNVVCIDHDSSGVLWPTCSPLERAPISVSAGLDFGYGLGWSGGAQIVAEGEIKMGANLGIGSSVALPMHRRLRYPLVPRPTTDFKRIGGNLLADSGVGAIVAGKSVVFSHQSFDGRIDFFVTRQEGARLAIGVIGELGFPDGTDDDSEPDYLADYCRYDDDDTTAQICPAGLDERLSTACNIGNSNNQCGIAADAGVTDRLVAGGLGETFDIQELRDAWEANTDAFSDVRNELKERLKSKISETFATLREFVDVRTNSTSGEGESTVIDKLISELRKSLEELFQELRDLVKELVACE